jgi:tetratricopeptide (TPR) repeat protein
LETEFFQNKLKRYFIQFVKKFYLQKTLYADTMAQNQINRDRNNQEVRHRSCLSIKTFSVEAEMAGKVKDREVNRGGFDSWISLMPLIVLTFIFSFIFFLTGCDETTSTVPQNEQIQQVPNEARKAELLEELDRKFENPQAHFQLGQIYEAEGLWPKAEYHYNVALRFDPSLREAQAAMVKLFLDSGETDKSKTYADIYMNQVSNSAAQTLRLGKAFQKENLDEYALECYRRALKLAPNSAEINKQLGYYYLSKDDTARAKEYLIKSFQLDSNQPEVAGELGRLGVEVKIPRNTQTSTKEGEKVAEQSD